MKRCIFQGATAISNVYRGRRTLKIDPCRFLKTTRPLRSSFYRSFSLSPSSYSPPSQPSRIRKEKDVADHQAKTQKLQRRAMMVTQAGAFINVFLSGCKSVVGFSIGSTALVGDAANSLGDVICDGIVYYSLVQSRKQASLDRPWGHGKFESLGSLCVGGLLVMTGMGVGYTAGVSAFDMIFGPDDIRVAADSIFSTVDKVAEDVRDIEELVVANNPVAKYLQSTMIGNFLANYGDKAAIGVSCISIICKETLFHYTLKVGKAIGSSSIMANAWQHRSDSFVSGAVLVGVTGTILGLPIMDPMAALLVSGVIIKQGVETGMESLRDLSDAPASREETEELRKTCVSVPGVIKINEIFARQSGPFLYVETTVGVPGYISASAAHRLAELVKVELLEQHRGRVANAVVHVEPLGATGLGEKAPEWARDHSFVRDSVDKCVVDFPEISTVTEVQVYYRDDGHLVLKVDVSMNPELTIKEAHITSIKLRELIEDSLPGVAAVDVDLELDEYEMSDLLDKDNMGYGVSYNSGCSSKGSIGSRKLSTKFGHSLNDPSSKYH